MPFKYVWKDEPAKLTEDQEWFCRAQTKGCMSQKLSAHTPMLRTGLSELVQPRVSLLSSLCVGV